MFDFNELEIIKDRESGGNKLDSFVGIRKNNQTGKMDFILPQGFEDFNPNYNNVKELFFSMYKTFKKFIQERKNITKSLDNKSQSKDNIHIESKDSYVFTDSNNDEVVIYSKIEVIETLIQVHKDLDIDTLIQEVGLIEDIDYSRVDNLVNNGVFLKNNSIVVDFMAGGRNVIRGIPAEIVEIYCYIYNELLVELDYYIDHRVKEIANNFSYKHLTAEQGLFNEYTFGSTIIVLKDRLDLVHKHTAYKDTSYWLIYDAVEKFLYSGLIIDNRSEKGFWGINNFHQIWEDMCNTFFIESLNENKLLYCDSQLSIERKLNNISRQRFGGFDILVDSDFVNNFYIDFSGNRRWMRPDLVVHNDKSNISLIDLLFSKKVITYEIEKTKSLFNNTLIVIKFSPKELIDDDISEDNKVSVFNDIINKFKIMAFRNPKKITKKYNSLTVKKVNSKLCYLNGISESDFLIELNNIFEDKRKQQPNPDIHCIDWKYLPLKYFEEDSPELKNNVTKQLTYDFCLSKNFYCKGKSIQSQFCIPYYISTDEKFKFHNISNITLQGIQVCKMNFNKVQSVYLNERF